MPLEIGGVEDGSSQDRSSRVGREFHRKEAGDRCAQRLVAQRHLVNVAHQRVHPPNQQGAHGPWCLGWYQPTSASISSPPPSLYLFHKFARMMP